MIWLTVGPVVGPAMASAGELSAVRLRAKTLAIGFLFNHFWSTIWNVVVPYMFNTDKGNLGGKTGWIFFVTSILAIAIIWYELPETKGLSFNQIDNRFEMRVPARKFKTSGDTEEELADSKLEFGEVSHVDDVEQAH